jgi:excisionase family DNA binding protein
MQEVSTLSTVDEPWFTTEQIAAQLQVSEFSVRRWLRTGRLRGVNFGGGSGWRVKDSDLRAFLEAQQRQSGSGHSEEPHDAGR